MELLLNLLDDCGLSHDGFDVGILVYLQHADVAVVNIVYKLLFLTLIDIVIPIEGIIELERSSWLLLPCSKLLINSKRTS